MLCTLNLSIRNKNSIDNDVWKISKILFLGEFQNCAIFKVTKKKKSPINFLQNRNFIAKSIAIGINLRIQSNGFKQRTIDYTASLTFTING